MKKNNGSRVTVTQIRIQTRAKHLRAVDDHDRIWATIKNRSSPRAISQHFLLILRSDRESLKIGSLASTVVTGKSEDCADFMLMDAFNCSSDDFEDLLERHLNNNLANQL